MKSSSLLAVGFVMVSSLVARADDLYLTDAGQTPAGLWLSEGGTAPRLIHRRETTADRAFPNAIMKLAQVTIGPDGEVFYVSGLDGCVMHLLDGRNEIMAFEVDGQVRDLASTGEEHTVYFSVVPTPQDGAPLADGKIYRRDLWEGRASEVATVRQADVGHNWWGTFTIKDGIVYVATLGPDSRIYKVGSSGAELAFETRLTITGLSVSPSGEFVFASGDRNVYRTSDFVTVEPIVWTARSLMLPSEQAVKRDVQSSLTIR